MNNFQKVSSLKPSERLAFMQKFITNCKLQIGFVPDKGLVIFTQK